MKKWLILFICFISVVLLTAEFLAPAAADTAAAITVDTTADAIDTSGDCSLREAILAANADTPVDGCAAGNGRDIVILPAGTFTFAEAGRNEEFAWTGDLDILDDISIIGAGFADTIIDADRLDNVFHLPDFANADIDIIGVTIENGTNGILLSGSGGVALFDSRVKGNSEFGVRGLEPGTVDIVLDGSRVDHNGLRGVINRTINGETLIDSSLVDNNQGGGILAALGSLTVVNSTISGNSTTSFGGGIHVDNGNCCQTIAKLYNVTIYNNQANTDDDGYGSGGGIYATGSDNIVEIRNTIIAGNTIRENNNGPEYDCGGNTEITSFGFNLIEDTRGCVIGGTAQGDITGVDPQLGLLTAGASGPSKAHSLLPLSPAIDAGNPLACVNEELNLLEVDQVDNLRPQDGDNDGGARCDIGAYETEYLPPSQIPANYIFTVDRTSDSPDRDPGDGACDASVNAGDQCTLRAAIEELNALGPGLNLHRIRFNIPGSGVHVISPASELPRIEVPVHINGASQPGASCPTTNEPANLLIQLDGMNAGIRAAGLNLDSGSDGSSISGLVITQFEGMGIYALGGDHTMFCNIIGLAPDGVTRQGNFNGIHMFGVGGRIGDADDVSQRNVIAGNQAAGVFVSGTNNVIAGNYMGTTADGLTAAGNGFGLYDYGVGNQIENNLISGNSAGVFLFNALGTEIFANLIGVAADGVSPLPNDGHGIETESSEQVTIGGPGPLGNTIAHNARTAVRVTDGESVAIRFNAIHDNQGLGIDLGGDGITANDDGDVDTGPNNLQNYPTLIARPAGFVVDGRLNSTPDTRFLVDVYRSSGCDPADYGEGETYLQTVFVQTDAAGQVEFELDLRGDLDTGDYVTATTTDRDGNTSEFSKCVRVGSRNGLTLTVNQDGDLDDAAPADGVCDTLPNLDGEQCTLRAALMEINALGIVSDTFRIEFDIAAADVVTITPETALPPILVPVELDGISQPGASCPAAGEPAQLKIVLDGSAISTTENGLILGEGSDGSLVRGLVIGNFRASGMRINSGYNQIGCNHIGVGADGVSPMENRFFGLYVSGLSNQIGDQRSPNRANVISHNGIDGIFIRYTASFTIVANNRIGTTADGRQPAGNQGSGITVSSELNIIGGGQGGGNLIGGNGRDGVTIYFANNNVMVGNTIGLNRDGSALPNDENGVAILGESSHNSVGLSRDSRLADQADADLGSAAQTAEWGNHIAFNGGHGVLIDENESAFGGSNAIRQNHIHDNVGLGIDLGDDGVDDIDDGVNTRQNHPVLTVTPGSHFLLIELNSLPDTTFDLDLFRGSGCDPSGHGEGFDFLIEETLSTDATGYGSITLDLQNRVSLGTVLTATATHKESRNTSEFSNCVTMTAGDLAYELFLPMILR